MRLEDAAVGLEQVASLHTRPTGPSTDEKSNVDAVKGNSRIIRDVDAVEHKVSLKSSKVSAARPV